MAGPERGSDWKDSDRSNYRLRGIRFSRDLDARVTRAINALETNRTEFVRQAVRELLERLERNGDLTRWPSFEGLDSESVDGGE